MQALARTTDPITSHKAAQEAELSGRAHQQRETCLLEVLKRPGQTAAEIALVAGLERHVPSRRLPELREAGLIENGKTRICRRTGRKSLIWLPCSQEKGEETMAPITNTTLVMQEPFSTYREKSKKYLSSHQLGDFRKCPLLYHKKREGLLPDQDRPAYLLGRAAHCLILEGAEIFDREYIVGGPVNPKTGLSFGRNTKAFAEWEAKQTKTILTDEQFELIAKMRAGFQGHDAAKDLVSNGMAEGVVRADYHGLPCQIRMDWFNPNEGIVDLKTCDDLTWFEADARRYGYMHQMAFYRAVLAQAVGTFVPVHMIAVEKKEPYRCGVWRLDKDALASAQNENEAAMDRLKKCVSKDKWTTGYEEPRVFDYI